MMVLGSEELSYSWVTPLDHRIALGIGLVQDSWGRACITKVILMGRIPIFNIWDFCLFSNTKVDQYQQRRNDNGYVTPAVHLYQ